MPYRITAAMTFPDDRDVWGGSDWLLYWQSRSALLAADESEAHPRRRAVRTPALASFPRPRTPRPGAIRARGKFRGRQQSPLQRRADTRGLSGAAARAPG